MSICTIGETECRLGIKKGVGLNKFIPHFTLFRIYWTHVMTVVLIILIVFLCFLFYILLCYVTCTRQKRRKKKSTPKKSGVVQPVPFFLNIESCHVSEVFLSFSLWSISYIFTCVSCFILRFVLLVCVVVFYFLPLCAPLLIDFFDWFHLFPCVCIKSLVSISLLCLFMSCLVSTFFLWFTS